MKSVQGRNQNTLAIIVILAGIAAALLTTSCGAGGTTGSNGGKNSTVTLSPSAVTIPAQLVGVVSAAHNVTLKNAGETALNIAAIIFNGTNPGDFAQTSNCGKSLAAGASCTIKVTFKPKAKGTRTANLVVDDADSSSDPSVEVSGTGVATSVSLAPTTLTFTNQKVGVASAAQSVTLTNTGTAALSVKGIAITGTNVADFTQTNNCGSTVAAGGKCTVSVIFKASAAGTRTAALSVTDDASGNPQTVSLSGTDGAAAVSVSPSSLSFGTVTVGNASAAQSITVTNSGSVPITISGVSVSGTNASEFSQSNNCGSTLAVSAHCTVNVVFGPSAGGNRSATLTIANSAKTQTVNLAGSGSAPAGGVTLSPTAVTFTGVPLSTTSAAESVTLTNNTAAAISISGFTITGANAKEFVQNNTCGSSLAAGAHCTIVLLFTPSALGTRLASLSVADNATGSPQTISLKGSAGHDVVLTWTASPTANIVGYNIYRGTKSGGEATTPLNTDPVNGTDYTDDEVTAGLEYFYKVTTVTSDGVTQSSASPETAAVIPSP